MTESKSNIVLERKVKWKDSSWYDGILLWFALLYLFIGYPIEVFDLFEFNGVYAVSLILICFHFWLRKRKVVTYETE